MGHDLFYIALSGRWILKIHDSHRVAVGWIILPRWGVWEFYCNKVELDGYFADILQFLLRNCYLGK
ncbi:MAG: hypothetical protein LBQ66_04765 [Planctomycetaceae bacterium]|nr:hypothetical protein [Planctomycetaceae bacterium]